MHRLRHLILLSFYIIYAGTRNDIKRRGEITYKTVVILKQDTFIIGEDDNKSLVELARVVFENESPNGTFEINSFYEALDYLRANETVFEKLLVEGKFNNLKDITMFYTTKADDIFKLKDKYNMYYIKDVKLPFEEENKILDFLNNDEAKAMAQKYIEKGKELIDAGLEDEWEEWCINSCKDIYGDMIVEAVVEVLEVLNTRNFDEMNRVIAEQNHSGASYAYMKSSVEHFSPYRREFLENLRV